MNLVVDASAAVEYLLQSSLGVRVGTLLVDADVGAPELLDAEVLAVLRREVLGGRLAVGRAQEAIEDLRDWGIERVPHRALLAGVWRMHANVGAYDALYVETARRNDAGLVTADGPLARAPRLGIAVHNVRLA